MDLIDLEEETIDAEILDSMAVSQDRNSLHLRSAGCRAGATFSMRRCMVRGGLGGDVVVSGDPEPQDELNLNRHSAVSGMLFHLGSLR